MCFETITLKGSAQVIVNFDDVGKCKKCKAPIVWAVSKEKKRYMPICKDIDGLWVSHFANCKYADKFRRKTTPGAGDILDELELQQKRERW